ncbi:MAG TPA: carboxymuconolactone decarboxylase family protein [Dehalococcoidia bacterium]|nr:carboxymuconolactone decarboxylase family protein [Dehalococcoidia bacterium]
MARLSNVERDQLKPEDQKYFDEITGSRGSIRGPYGILLHSPDVAARVAHTGAYVRFDFTMPESLKETVIITAAAHQKSQYEFAAHARLARQAGVSEETIKAIADGSAPSGLSGDEELLVRYTTELLRNKKITDATFNAVKDKWGEKGVVDVTTLIGHYLLVAQILAAFDVELAPGMTAELPD